MSKFQTIDFDLFGHLNFRFRYCLVIGIWFLVIKGFKFPAGIYIYIVF